MKTPKTSMLKETDCDVLVLGAGAAGLMCAFEAGRRDRSVILLDHADRIGKKILISGGGRCNFTNLHTRAENFLSENPHFAKSALARFTAADMVALVEKHSVPYHEKTLGQLFCDHSAQDIVALLERECADANVRIITGTQIRSVNADGTGKKRFHVETSRGSFSAESLVIATGGLSIPKMGATSLGYELARQFGHRIVPCRPGLVPLTFNAADLAWSDLSGLSAEVVASVETSSRGESGAKIGSKSGARVEAGRSKVSFREKLLITHRGLSGPAVLQISSFWKTGEILHLDLAPGREVTAALLDTNARRDMAAAKTALCSVMPARLAERWITTHPPADWTNRGLARMEKEIHSWQIMPEGTEGYAKAEVTVGGVDTRELDARTMQSLKVPGLFFVGEVVDVTGWLGGYNFQWAWAAAVSAGRTA